MKHWYDEDYRFVITVLSVGTDGDPIRHCRNGHEAGDRYVCTYGCPEGFCSKSMAKLFPLQEAVRSGGDLRLLGGSAPLAMEFTCPDGEVLFRMEAERTAVDPNGPFNTKSAAQKNLLNGCGGFFSRHAFGAVDGKPV